MSKWGVFHDGDIRHSAPCDAEGNILPPHELRPACECRPFEVDGIIVHVDPERGGGRSEGNLS